MSEDESLAWAKAILVTDSLLHGHSKNVAASEPRVAVQIAIQNVILCDAPVERYSKSTPVFSPQSPAEDESWRPIDVVYGSYNPRTRCIEIYIDNIAREAALYGEYADVLQVVRLHEYAHAMVHLGVRLDQVSAVLGNIGMAGVTNWDAFVENRTRAYEEIDSASHEFLAQAITFAVIASLPNESDRKRLSATFEALEKKQPPEYVVSEDLKAVALHSVDWSSVVAAATRDVDLFRGEGFSLRGGLAALVREMGVRQESSSVESAFNVPLGNEVKASDPAAAPIDHLIDHLVALKDALRRSIAVGSDDWDIEQIGALRQRLQSYASLLGTLSECLKATLQKSDTELAEILSGSRGKNEPAG